MIVYAISTTASVILSERSESKDLRTEMLLSTMKMRRFFDFAAPCAAPLRMTCVLGNCSAKRSFTAAAGAAMGFLTQEGAPSGWTMPLN